MSALGRRQKRSAGGGGAAAWLLTYGDMVTLLMAFFVMLFAVSSIEQEKFEAFLSGLAGFDNPAAGETADPIGDPVPPVLESSPIAPIMPGEMRQLGERMMDALAEAGHAGDVELQYDERGLALVVGTDDVLFHTGSSVVTDQGRGIVAAVAPELAGLANEILVEGHTDDVPLNRNGDTNWNLSTDRAVAVVQLLASAHGLPPTRLTASGYGEFRPRDVGRTAEARARNRRVEVVVLAGTEADAEEIDRIIDPAGVEELFQAPTGIAGGGSQAP